MCSASLREDLCRDGLSVVCADDPNRAPGERAVDKRLVTCPAGDPWFVTAPFDLTGRAHELDAVAQLLIENVAPGDEGSSGPPVPAGCVEERDRVRVAAKLTAQEPDPLLARHCDRSLVGRYRVAQEREHPSGEFVVRRIEESLVRHRLGCHRFDEFTRRYCLLDFFDQTTLSIKRYMSRRPESRAARATARSSTHRARPGRRGGSSSLGAELMNALGANVVHALEALQFAAFTADHERRVRWQNAAAIALVGDLRGKLDRTFVAPEDLARVRDAFARKQMGAAHTEYEATLVRTDGTRVGLAFSSVPLRDTDGTVIGSFALARPVGQAQRPAAASPRLTARQRQILTLLAAGRSTSQMAESMGLSNDTVRNHVKKLLQRLDARSRIEAVAKARRANLI
jgi:DNA-binding CsgD family transcriptional regulator